MTQARKGFFPLVLGDQVSVKQAGGLVYAARNNLHLSQGGGQLIGAGNNLTVTEGGGWVMGAGNSVSVDHGGAGIVGAPEVRVDRSVLGVAVGNRVSVEDSRVVFGSAGSLVVGVLIGFLAGLLRRRRRRGR